MWRTYCALRRVELSSLHRHKGKHLWMLNVAQVSSCDSQHTSTPATTRCIIYHVSCLEECGEDCMPSQHTLSQSTAQSMSLPPPHTHILTQVCTSFPQNGTQCLFVLATIIIQVVSVGPHFEDNIKELTSLPKPELLTRASYSKDWKRISAESSLIVPIMTQSVKGLN